MICVGESYNFSLAGLAYNLRVVQPEPIVVSDPERIREMRRTWASVGMDEDPNDPAPITIRTDGMAAFLPLDEGAPDEASIRAPVKEVITFQLGERPIHAIRVPVFRLGDGEDFDLWVYADSHVIKGDPPTVGDDVEGTIWLQGHLTD